MNKADAIDRIASRINITEFTDCWSGFESCADTKSIILYGVGFGCDLFLKRYGDKYSDLLIIDKDPRINGAPLATISAEGSKWSCYEKTVIHNRQQIDDDILRKSVIVVCSINYGLDIKKELESKGLLCFSVVIMELRERMFGDLHSKELILDYQREIGEMKINPGKISIFATSKYSGHGKAIVENLLRNNIEIEIVWITCDWNYNVPNNIKKVYSNNKRLTVMELETSRIIMDDTGCLPEYYRKRINQTVIELKHWSSITLKSFAAEVARFRGNKRVQDMYSSYGKLIDYFLVGSEFDEQTCREGFDYQGNVVNIGSPRSDILFNSGEITAVIKKKLNIDKDTHVLLYAPTFRYQEGNELLHELYCGFPNFEELIKALMKRFGGRWNIMLRLHPLVAQYSKELTFSCNVIDVSHESDSQELAAACDAMITDYSSIMFEPAFVRKPVFLFAPDKDEYINGERELLIDYDTLPFPIATTNDELAYNIKTFDYDKYVSDVDAFMDKYGVHEDGHASERAAEFICGLIDGDEEKINKYIV